MPPNYLEASSSVVEYLFPRYRQPYHVDPGLKQNVFSRGPIPEDEERSSDAAMGGGGGGFARSALFCVILNPILRVRAAHGRVASAQHVARGVTKETDTIARNRIAEESFCIVGRV
jgi:hypothetical protein